MKGDNSGVGWRLAGDGVGGSTYHPRHRGMSLPGVGWGLVIKKGGGGGYTPSLSSLSACCYAWC
jgi:hypothetical protein